MSDLRVVVDAKWVQCQNQVCAKYQSQLSNRTESQQVTQAKRQTIFFVFSKFNTNKKIQIILSMQTTENLNLRLLSLVNVSIDTKLP